MPATHNDPAGQTPNEQLFPRSPLAPIVDALVDGIAVIDTKGTLLRANKALCEMFGYIEEELTGRNVSVLMTTHDADQHDAYLDRYQATGDARVIGSGREVVGQHKDGRTLDLELSVTPAVLNNTNIYIGFLRDITERKEAEALYQMNNRVMRAVNHALANILNEGMSTREVFNSALDDLLEVTASEYGFIGEILHEDKVPYLKTHAITNIAWNRETREFYKQNVRSGLEFRNLDSLFGVTIRSGQMVITNSPHEDPRRGGLPKGHPSLERYLGVPIYSGPKLLGMAGIANRKDGYDEELVDQIKPLVSALGTLIAAHQNNQTRIRAEEELFHTRQQLKLMATKDPITNIANRYMLVQELEVAYERCHTNEDFSILFIDIDHFKQINDRYGHNLGDQVLKHIASHLEDSIRPTDVVGRYGGEEFLIGLPNCTPENAHIIADRMRAALNKAPLVIENGIELTVSMSIGVAALSQHPGNLEELIKFADQAMYAAKAQGRNKVVAFQNAG
jgi:diguanylate cyclase (GGDEF)-like protein/PAS domain S-box-containing protein